MNYRHAFHAGNHADVLKHLVLAQVLHHMTAKDKPFTLIDTAGLRRKGKVFEAIEKFSVVKTLQAIADANVVLLLLDATQGVTDQDAHIAGYILESGRAVVVAINKWDATDDYQRQMLDVQSWGFDRQAEFGQRRAQHQA